MNKTGCPTRRGFRRVGIRALNPLVIGHIGNSQSRDRHLECQGDSIAWQPGYNEATNRYTLAGTSYDANGNLLNDSFHAYTWDSEGNTLGIDAINLTYDALDRVVEQNPSSGTYYQIVYTPMGTKLGVFKASVIQQAYVPLPGGMVKLPHASQRWLESATGQQPATTQCAVHCIPTCKRLHLDRLRER